MSAPPEKKSPPVAATTEGASNRVEANAGSRIREAARNSNAKPFGHRSRTKAAKRMRRDEYPKVTFRASTGRIWGYRGKIGKALAMLASRAEGVTQWDTLPWHTRLGGSIHRLREDGLDISTEREGEYRHARYRLRTPGSLIIQRENSEARS